jgi:hypothetical protein
MMTDLQRDPEQNRQIRQVKKSCVVEPTTPVGIDVYWIYISCVRIRLKGRIAEGGTYQIPAS